MTISTSPMRPSSMAAFSAMKSGSKRRLKPTIRVAPLASTTFRQACTRADDRSTGFSQNTALPALANCSIRSAWVSVGVQITTASMSAAAAIVVDACGSRSRKVACTAFAARLDRVGDGDEAGAGDRADGAGVDLADAAGAEDGEVQGHVRITFRSVAAARCGPVGLWCNCAGPGTSPRGPVAAMEYRLKTMGIPAPSQAPAGPRGAALRCIGDPAAWIKPFRSGISHP